MNEEIINFLKDLPSPNERFNEYEFFIKGAVYLEDKINDYLKSQGLSSRSFHQGISKARAIPNKDTNKRFWHAVDTFRMVRNAYAHPKNAQKITKRKWIRFINIIENLQNYKGAQVFPMKHIRSKRVFRLYFAYMLTWEHLRYVAGNDDGYSPSTEILKAYGAALEDYDHSHA